MIFKTEGHQVVSRPIRKEERRAISRPIRKEEGSKISVTPALKTCATTKFKKESHHRHAFGSSRLVE